MESLIGYQSCCMSSVFYKTRPFHLCDRNSYFLKKIFCSAYIFSAVGSSGTKYMMGTMHISMYERYTEAKPANAAVK